VLLLDSFVDLLVAVGRGDPNEVGCLDLRILGLPPAAIMTGGSKVELHSLARVDEYVCGKCMIVGAKYRTDHHAGPALFLDTLNRYWESGGPALITERRTMIYRLM
jgi:hypothetical protein